MSVKKWIARFVLSCVLGSQIALAQSPPSVPVPPIHLGLPQPVQPAVLQPAQPEPEPPDIFAQAPPQAPPGTSAGSGHPHMIGDLNGGAYIRRSVICASIPSSPGGGGGGVSGVSGASGASGASGGSGSGFLSQNVKCLVNIPLASRGPFKIGENESPLPTDRFFLTYNYFSNVAVLPQREIVSGSPQIPGASFKAKSLNALALSSQDPADSLRGLDLHRETLGFEKTLFSDDFSVGFRMPLIQERGNTALENSQLGDLSFVFKYAFYHDREAGNVISTGMVLTAPTGEDLTDTVGETIHPTLLQPFVGWFLNRGSVYFHGFSSVVFPTDSRDSTLFCNDLAVGYRLYEDESATALVRFITPTLEAHITTPLTNQGADEAPAGFPNIFVGTGAVHVGLGDRSTLTVGVGVPMTGPQPFDVEGIVQFNLRF